MIVKKLDIWHLRLGFLSPIKHNLATHQGSDNLVLRVTTDEGMTGFGEGVPRAFVTGGGAQRQPFVPPAGPGPGNISPGVSSTQALLQGLRHLYEQAQAQRHPAAFCAMETALLDAAGRTWDMSVTGLIGPKLRTSLEYSAVIP